MTSTPTNTATRTPTSTPIPTFTAGPTSTAVPATIETLSTSANSMLKHRPQLAVGSDGTVYAVWDENTDGAVNVNNGYNLYLSYRNPGSGSWSTPLLIPATDRARWPAGTYPYVNDWYPRIALDTSNNLHIAYSERYQPTSGTTRLGVYYIVAENPNTGAPTWSSPKQIDTFTDTSRPTPTATATAGPGDTNALYNQDDIRFYVQSAGGSGSDSTAYFLWTGTDNSRTYLSRAYYANGTNTITLLDDPARTNPGFNGTPTPVAGGPVGINQTGASTLQLIYASKNTTAGGNTIHSASFDESALTWSTSSTFVGNLADDCSISGCTGATTAYGNSVSYVAANWDVSIAGTPTPTNHRVQVTMNNGTASSIFVEHTGTSTRQPVVVYEPITGKVVVLYNTCTYVSASSCTGRDIWYRTFDGATWSSPTLLSPTTGDQLEITAVAPGQTVGGVNGAVHVTWVNQPTASTYQVQYQVLGITP